MAATEEREAVGARHQSGVGRVSQEEGAVAASHAAARESQGAQGGANAYNSGYNAGQQMNGQAAAGQQAAGA